MIAKGKVQKVGYRDYVQDKIKYGTVPEELGDRIIELIQNIKQESFFS